MKTGFHSRVKKLFGDHVPQSDEPARENLDLEEEYANAFRTESYTEFWIDVLALKKSNLTARPSVGSTTAARLPSYRIFAEHLVDPSQPTVRAILDVTRIPPNNLKDLNDYFTNTCDASNLCGLLLKDIDHTRKRYKSLQDSFKSSCCNNYKPCRNNVPTIVTRVTLFSECNPFCPTAPSLTQFQVVQTNCSNLLKKLESRCNKTQSKVGRLKKLRYGSTVFLVALTVSLVVIVVTHGFVLLVAAPGLMISSLELISIKKLSMYSAQLNAAAKGIYILIRDLDTISRLVTRLNIELEHMEYLMRMWLEREANGELVACQLKKIDQSFIEQLDELEEHLYLCFMTINRARNLVVKEIVNPS